MINVCSWNQFSFILKNQDVLRSCGAAELVEVGLIFVAWSSSARSVIDSFDPRDLKWNWFILQSR